MNNWDFMYDSKFCSIKLCYLGFHSSSSIKLSLLLFLKKITPWFQSFDTINEDRH